MTILTLEQEVDILIVGAGPVGLLAAYLARLCGLSVHIADKSSEPLRVGRADALNARTLQLLAAAGLFDELYPHGKPCNTSSVWANGAFVSRQSSWWEELPGCLHKHFLMLGQSYIENLLDRKLSAEGTGVRRETTVEAIEVNPDGCLTRLSNGDQIRSAYVIGADGSRSFVRERFGISFQVERPQLIWAVIDGIIATDFPKVPEIIVFQTETSDVAWIPREGEIDRFYVRMDTKNFSLEEAVEKIKRAVRPHALEFKDIAWFSQFSVKESVAERFQAEGRVFLAGDACHIHSVNGGQGLNTGLADAFNLIWKILLVKKYGASPALLGTYENERKPVALSVVAASGELVRSTKYSEGNTHAQDYVEIVKKRAGNITGMGIRYGEDGLAGTRFFDFELGKGTSKLRIYSLLDYSRFTLFLFGEAGRVENLPSFVKVIRIGSVPGEGLWAKEAVYAGRAVLVRPDAYIAGESSLGDVSERIGDWLAEFGGG